MSGLKQRARTLQELAENALFLIHSRPLPLDEKAQKILEDSEVASLLRQVLDIFQTLPEWEEKNLEEALRTLAESLQIKMGALAQPLRAALTGQSISPGIFDVMMTLGREESLERIQDVLKF